MIELAPQSATHVRIAAVKQGLGDGPGTRTSVYFQGCPIGRAAPCAGCQSRQTWAADGGEVVAVEELAQRLVRVHTNRFTFIGGDPLDQPVAAGALAARLRQLAPQMHLIVYTGFRWDELHPVWEGQSDAAMFGMARLLVHADVLVDGRYERGADDHFVQFRGSRNQRPILLRETFARGEVVVDETWDRPRFTVQKGTGAIFGARGHVEELAGDEPTEAARMCGQLKGRGA